MAGFKRLLFKRRKTQPTTETTTATAPITPSPAAPPPTHAPPPEDTADRQPPPYSPSSASQPEPNVRVSGLLDPNLNFTAAQMQQQWRAKDKRFASAVVQFVAERFDGKLKGWAGYKYTYICEVSTYLNSSDMRTRIPQGRKVHGTIVSGLMHGDIADGINLSVRLRNEISNDEGLR
jgi:hypothetical protein